MIRFIKMQIFPILFSTTVAIAMLNTFTNDVLVLILPVLFITASVFYYCCFAMFHKEKARLYFLCGFAAVLFLVYLLIRSEAGELSFLDWILMSNAGAGESTSYFISVFILFCFFVATAVFYFTNIIYRAPYLLMIILVPCLLYSRKYGAVPPVYIVLLVTLYFIVMIFFGNTEIKKSTKIIARAGLSKAVGIFAAILFFLTFGTSLIEPSSASIMESPINNLIPKDMQVNSVYALSRYNRYSGSADNGQASDQILFLVEADEPIYFTTQVFGNYDGKRWVAIDDNLYYGEYEWEETASKFNFDMLFQDIQKVCRDGYDSGFANEYGNGIENLNNIEEKKEARIIPQDFPTRYVLAPIRTVEVSGVPNRIRYIRANIGEIFLEGNGVMNADRGYNITYYRDIFRENADFQNYAAQFDFDGYEKLLTDLYYIERSYGGENFNAVSSYFMNELAYGQMFSEYSERIVSAKITSLAQEITQGANSDYEKAVAIEQYFHNNDYKYDLNYRPPSGSEDIEYFIFESKTGTCSNYATAMTLLARSAGLNARYVEGFVASEKNDEGQYVIKGKNSHAFTQVFIPIYGWVTFDATVSATNEAAAEGIGAIGKIISDNAPVIFGGFTALIISGTLIYLIFVNLIAERLFRLKIAKNNGRNSVILIYNKVLRLINQKLGIYNITAPAAARTVKEKYGINIEAITDCFERTAFNEEDISNKEKKSAISSYMQFYSGLRSKHL